MKRILFLIPALAMMVIFQSCGNRSFQETDSGLEYKFHQSNRGPKPTIDNIVRIDFAYRFPADSVFFHSAENDMPGLIRVEASQYPGDIYEAIRMMSKGDSASFRMDAKRFFTITMGSPTVPDFIGADESLYVDIVMHDIFDQEGYERYMEQLREEQMKEQEMAAANEDRFLQEYLRENNIDVEPESSGLIIIIEKEGSGPIPTAGQTVRVHYTGMMLDGTVFDSSLQRGEPLEFVLGRGQVIRGWDEGLSKIRVGTVARFIIPSYLGYGDRSMGSVITPFSTLVFDVELIDAL